MADRSLGFNITTSQDFTRACASMAAAGAGVEKMMKRLDGLVAKMEARLDTTGISRGEAAVEAARKRIDGKKATVKVDVDKSLGDSLIQVNLLGRALKAIALPASAIAAAPQIAALGSAAMSAVGSVGLLPGVIGAAGLAAGVAKTSFGNLFEYFTASSDKKRNEAFEKLSADGKKLAETVDGLKPRFEALTHSVQDAVFRRLSDQVKPLADAYLPALQREMLGVGRVFNTTALSLAGFFRQKKTSDDLTASLGSMRLAVTNVMLAARPLAQVLVDVLTTSSARLPNLTRGFTDLAVRFAAFVNNARNSGQLGAWIDKGVESVSALGRITVNVGSILMSVFRSATSEGQNMLRVLAEGTGQVAAFLKSAQGQSTLGAVFGTITAGVAALKTAIGPLLPLLVDVVRIVGANLVAVFQALSGPLNQLTTALTNSLGPVLPVIADSFRMILMAIIPMIAPILALIPAFDSIAQVMAAASVVAAKFLQAMAGTGAALFSTIVPLIRATAETLTVLLHVIEPIAPALGMVTAAFLAWKTATSVIGTAQAMITGFAAKIADAALNAGVFTEKVTGSAAAGERLALAGGRLSGALGMIGTALPIVALAAGAAALQYEQMRDKSEELATSVVRGEMEMSAAVAEHANRLQTQQMVMQQVSGETEAMGQGIGELTGQLQENSNQVDANAVAQEEMAAAVERQAASLPPLEAAQLRVRLAQDAYNQAVAQFGPNSSQAIAAMGNLSIAKDREKQATDAAAQSEKTLGDAIVDTSNKAAAAANADIAYQQAVLNIAQAEDAAAEAVRLHGEKSREAQQAHLQVMQAYLSAADAARRKAEADAAATGASNAAQIGAQAYKDALIQLASQATGPTRDALLAMANGTNTAGQAASTAELQSRLYKDELGQLAGQANGPLAAALSAARQNFDTLGGAHATAEQRAAAQKAELQRLANMASGPVKVSLQQMADQIRTLPDGDFTVTGIGKVSYGSPELLRAAHGGYTGGVIGMNRRGLTGVSAYRDGGVTPGYTPGRDVHQFYSPTGGRLDLSGGESVMRPEWTAVIGVDNVNAMNAAARGGGVTGVRRFLSGQFANGGVLPHQRFAMGGGINLTGTQPFSVIPKQIYGTVAGSLVGTISSNINSAIKRLAEMAAAAAAAVANFAGAAVGIGGGSAKAWIIQHESGGNPRAQNPTSSASGLFQMIDGTWRAYGGSTAHAKDASVAEQNAVADRYVAARYGSWENAQRFWMAHHYYDRGGRLMPGSTLATNHTGAPERVLSGRQTAAFEQLVSAISGPARAATAGVYTRGDGALLSELRQQNKHLRELRGDVDQGGYFGALIGELQALRAQLAGGGSSAVAGAASARTDTTWGAF